MVGKQITLPVLEKTPLKELITEGRRVIGSNYPTPHNDLQGNNVSSKHFELY